MKIRRRLPSLNVENVALILVAAVTVAVVVIPLFYLVMTSFLVERLGEPTIVTIDNYIKVLSDRRLLKALGNTLYISIGCSTIATVIGVTLAWITARTDAPYAGKLEAFNLIPFYVSPLVGAICWIYLASPNNGLINVAIANIFGTDRGPFDIYSGTGIIWVMGLFYTPYMYLFTIGSLRKMDPSLEEAARISGCGLRQTIFKITLPLVMPGIVFGFSLTLVTSMGMLGVPAALGTPVNILTLATLIYSTLELDIPDFNMAATYGMVMLALASVTVMAQRRVLLPRQFTTVTGKGYRPSTMKLGKWRFAALGFSLAYLVIAVILPFTVLIIVSISQYWDGHINPDLFTFNNYKIVLFDESLTRRAIKNSLFMATITATLVILLAYVIAYIIYRTKAFGRGALDFIVTIPAGIPGIVVAMGVLVAYIRTPAYGTIWILVLACLTRYLPVGLKNVSAAFISVGPELEESARICGAGWLRTAWSIALPVMKPGLVAAWLLLFLIFLRELNTTILLFSPGSEVMSVALFVMLENATSGNLAAFAIIQTVFTLSLVFIVKRISGGDATAG